MKTTLNLPDDLMREVKMRAAAEDRKLTDMLSELLRRGLQQRKTTANPDLHVRLPLVQCAHPADTSEEITPERAADILLAQEAADR